MNCQLCGKEKLTSKNRNIVAVVSVDATKNKDGKYPQTLIQMQACNSCKAKIEQMKKESEKKLE